MDFNDIVFLVFAFAIVFIAAEVLHFIERQKLYRYIKSDSVKEYDNKKSPPKPLQSGHRKSIDKWHHKEGGGE